MSFPELASAQGPTLTRAEGTLPDGTPWEIVVPSNWNGTLLVDLDFASSQGRYATLHARGFAGAGIRREGGAGDARANSDAVHPGARHFRRALRKAGPYHRERPVQRRSDLGGDDGNVPREDRWRSDAVHGIRLYSSYNGKLDHAFAAQVLLETDLAIVNIPTASAQYSALTSAWSDLITAAQATPQGKARHRSRARTGSTASLDQSQPAQAGSVE